MTAVVPTIVVKKNANKTRLRCIVTGESVGCAPEVFNKRAAVLADEAKEWGITIDVNDDDAVSDFLRKNYVSREGRRLLREDFFNFEPKQAIDLIREQYGVKDAETLNYPSDEHVAVIRRWGKDPTAPKGTPGRKADPEKKAEREKVKAEREQRKAFKEMQKAGIAGSVIATAIQADAAEGIKHTKTEIKEAAVATGLTPEEITGMNSPEATGANVPVSEEVTATAAPKKKASKKNS